MKTWNEEMLLPGERIDDLQRNGYGIIQKSGGFCFGMDAVLLSGFARVRRGEQVLDLGTGTGIIPLLLCAKTPGKKFYGLEVQPEVAEMAERSVCLNGLCGRVEILSGNLREILLPGEEVSFPPASEFKNTAAGGARKTAFGDGSAAEGNVVLKKGSFDVVTSNPPYMKAAHGLKNPGEAKAISRHELLCTLEEVCAAAGKLLRDGGRFYMVHRPQRLLEITEALLSCRLEPKRMKFVHPYADREANMVLIEAVKGAGRQCRIEKPLIVYRAPGVYMDEIYELYGY